jgi:hypothetical protein
MFTIRSINRLSREKKDHGSYHDKDNAESDLNALAVLDENFGDFIWNVIDLDKEAADATHQAKLARRRKSRRSLIALYKGLGMTKVRGSAGGVFYE